MHDRATVQVLVRQAVAEQDVLCIAGPTASGKSALAMELARQCRAAGRATELICVDSATIYRGMDIGSAKPDAQARAEFVHHLLDIKEPTVPYSAADFARDARAAITQARARGALPILVGGTMLYFKVLMQGIGALPGANRAIRAQLDEEASRHGWPALHRQLAHVDPLSASRIAPGDSQRIQRALEVYLCTGIALSAHFAHQKQTFPVTSSDTGLRFKLIALEPQDRVALHARIAQRFERMLEEGFVEEVRALRARGDLSLELPSMRCVGYRQIWEYLDGACQYAQMRERGIAASRQLAKRQLTWLRSWSACGKQTLEPFF